MKNMLMLALLVGGVMVVGGCATYTLVGEPPNVRMTVFPLTFAQVIFKNTTDCLVLVTDETGKWSLPPQQVARRPIWQVQRRFRVIGDAYCGDVSIGTAEKLYEVFDLREPVVTVIFFRHDFRL